MNSWNEISKKINHWSTQLKSELLTINFIIRDSETPLYLKIISYLILSYAFSPIDLIPDFIPILGYLDDILIVSIGIYLIIKFVPKAVLARARENAKVLQAKPISYLGAGIVVFIWILFLIFSALLIGKR